MASDVVCLYRHNLIFLSGITIIAFMDISCNIFRVFTQGKSSSVSLCTTDSIMEFPDDRCHMHAAALNFYNSTVVRTGYIEIESCYADFHDFVSVGCKELFLQLRLKT